MKMDALWRSVVEIKYGSRWGGWCSNVAIGSFGFGVWKNISRGWGKFYIFIRF